MIKKIYKERVLMHYSDGILRAYLDNELIPNELQRISKHIGVCEVCQEKIRILRNNAFYAEKLLADLAADPGKMAIKSADARGKFNDLIEKTEGIDQTKAFDSFKRVFTFRNRPVLAAVIPIIIVGLLFMFPQVRATAVEFLAIFRVQKIEVIEFNPANLPEEFKNRFATLERFLSENIDIVQSGTPQVISNASEASLLAGFDIRFPSNLSGNERLTYQPEVKAQIQADIPLMTSFLNEIGAKDIWLPESLHGETIDIIVEKSVTLVSGTCLFSEKELVSIPIEQRHCLSFTQMPSPKIHAPPGLKIEPFGISLLQVLGLTSEEAYEFSRNINWSTTLVIPIPQDANYRRVDIEGVRGVLFIEENYHPQHYTMIWVKNEILYGLSGNGDYEDARIFINSLN